jgi:hypothetical protein
MSPRRQPYQRGGYNSLAARTRWNSCAGVLLGAAESTGLMFVLPIAEFWAKSWIWWRVGRGWMDGYTRASARVLQV